MKHTITDRYFHLSSRHLFIILFLLVFSSAASSALAQDTGVLEICSEASGPGLEDRIFRYQIGADIYEVPFGSCSGPITLNAGNAIVTELANGRTFSGGVFGTFSGRFRLLDISQISGSANALGAVNLTNRTAVVSIAPGNITNMTVIKFTNTFAVSAVVEICKQQLTGASGVFNFTIDALPNQTFAVPAGQCSGPITVNVPTSPASVPAPAVVKITELARQGYTLSTAAASPANRLINFNLNIGINNANPLCLHSADPVADGCAFPNQGGGYVEASVLEGGSVNQTTATFSSVFNTNPATGILQICKTVTGGGLDNRIFQFKIGANTYEVPVGQCSGPITVNAGAVTIEELTTGRTILASGGFGTFAGGFSLNGVSAIPAGALGAVNLPARTAVVNVVEGNITNQTVVTFNNRQSITGILEICSYTLDQDVSGIFSYTIDALPNQVVQVPAGQCSAPLQVSVPSPKVRVTSIGKSGFTTESASAVPSDRFISLTPGLGINNANPACFGSNDPAAAGCTFNNTGGGYAEVNVVEGGVANETLVRFNHRSNPAPLKICKIGEPGINIGDLFQFNVTGTSAAAGGQVTRTVSVPAGPAAQGGFCSVVTDNSTSAPERFVVGTKILVDEVGPVNAVATKIVSTAGADVAASTQANPAQVVMPDGSLTSVYPNADTGQGRVIVTARGIINAIEYTNAPFTPTLLKICKLAGPGITTGTTFTFDVTVNNQPGFAPQAVTVLAGPAAQGGFCAFAPGPYPTNSSSAFNLGQTVTVTERSVAGTVVAGINSSTGPVQSADVGNRTATFVLGAAGVNEISFTNTVFNPATLKICKIAGPGVALGTFFTFDVAVNNEPNLTVAPVSVAAGPAVQGGFCSVVQGPYSSSFRDGQIVTVTERAAGGLAVTAITSATGPLQSVNLAGRSAVIQLGSGTSAPLAFSPESSVHELTFTNGDATPPVITPQVNGVLGSNGYYLSDVGVNWNVEDAESSVSSSSGCGATTVTSDTTGTILTCTATSGGGTSSRSVTVKRDTTPPVVSFGAPNISPNAAGWYNSNVSFSYSVGDAVSGLSAATPSTGSVVLSSEGSAVSGSVTVTDNAGNSASYNTPAVKIDKTAPVLSNLNNIRIDSGVPAAAVYNVTAADALTPSPTVVCNPASGFVFPVGTTTVNCTAADLAGNQAAGSFSVAVFSDGQQPVPTGSNVTVEPETGLPDAGLSLTFNQVDATGVTTVQPIADPATAGEVPGGFSISNTIAYQIETTAQFSGPVVLAFQVPFTDADNNGIDDETGTAFADLRILHREQTGVDANNQPVFSLVDRTILPPDSPAPNLTARTIYARTTSFSPFYVAQKVNYQILPLFNLQRAGQPGSAFPLMLKLLNAAGTRNLSSPNIVLTVRGVSSLSGGGLMPASSPGNSNPDNTFEFKKADGGLYNYNLKTTGLKRGKYVLSFYVGSDRSYFYTVRFDLK